MIYATEVVWTAQHIISTVRWKLVGICQSSLHRSKNSFLQNGIFLKRRIYLGLQIIRSVDLPNFFLLSIQFLLHVFHMCDEYLFITRVIKYFQAQQIFIQLQHSNGLVIYIYCIFENDKYIYIYLSFSKMQYI